MALYIAVVPTTDIDASESEVLGCAPRAVLRIDATWSIAAVLNGSNFVSTLKRAERPSVERNIFAAFLKSSEVITLGGMYMPAMEFREESRFIDSSKSAAGFSA